MKASEVTLEADVLSKIDAALGDAIITDPDLTRSPGKRLS